MAPPLQVTLHFHGVHLHRNEDGRRCDLVAEALGLKIPSRIACITNQFSIQIDAEAVCKGVIEDTPRRLRQGIHLAGGWAERGKIAIQQQSG